jgi:hypothetical protein
MAENQGELQAQGKQSKAEDIKMLDDYEFLWGQQYG